MKVRLPIVGLWFLTATFGLAFAISSYVSFWIIWSWIIFLSLPLYAQIFLVMKEDIDGLLERERLSPKHDSRATSNARRNKSKSG